MKTAKAIAIPRADEVDKPDKDLFSQIAAESKVSDIINVGAVGTPLIVPHEDLDDECDDGEELNTAGPIRIRKPTRREWISINVTAGMTCQLLQHKAKPDAIETEYFFISPNLRGPIRDELKKVRVFPYYSFASSGFGLLLVNVTVGNSWYESWQILLNKPASFFEQHAVRVISDKEGGRYRVRFKPIPAAVPAITKPVSELLGEALGADHLITTPDHPLYQDLVSGLELA